MTETANRRNESRIRLSYPIRLHRNGIEGAGVLGQTVTRNLSARGAYFATWDGTNYGVGQRLGVVVSVPHRFGAGRRDVLLDLRGEGTVVRLDRPRLAGEDGRTLTGVAVRFDLPLQFRYAWV